MADLALPHFLIKEIKPLNAILALKNNCPHDAVGREGNHRRKSRPATVSLEREISG
jgi:hypothetical protein